MKVANKSWKTLLSKGPQQATRKKGKRVMLPCKNLWLVLRRQAHKDVGCFQQSPVYSCGPGGIVAYSCQKWLGSRPFPQPSHHVKFHTLIISSKNALQNSRQNAINLHGWPSQNQEIRIWKDEKNVPVGDHIICLQWFVVFYFHTSPSASCTRMPCLCLQRSVERPCLLVFMESTLLLFSLWWSCNLTMPAV